MKKELRIPTWIVLMVFTLTLVTFDFIFSIRNVVQNFGLYNEYESDIYLAPAFYTLFTGVIISPFLFTVTALLSRKNPILLVPLGLLVGALHIGELVYFIRDLISNRTDWYVVFMLLLSLGCLIASIIGFFQAKPLAKEEKKTEATSNQRNDEYFEEVPNKPAKESNKKIPFDDILKAKELFDAGAITQEEFTEIKRRAIE